MDALFAAFSLDSLIANLTSLLIVGVGMFLMHVGYRFLRRAAYGLDGGGYDEHVRLDPVAKSILRHHRKHGR